MDLEWRQRTHLTPAGLQLTPPAMFTLPRNWSPPDAYTATNSDIARNYADTSAPTSQIQEIRTMPAWPDGLTFALVLFALVVVVFLFEDFFYGP
jgi:hypothetical protein